MGISNFPSMGGSSSEIYVPRQKYSETLKRLMNTLDLVSNKTNDFKQIVKQSLPMLTDRDKFQKIDFGSKHDGYRLNRFMESSLSILSVGIEDAIQADFQYREEILENKELYQELTREKLTEDQQDFLLEFESIFKDAYLAKAIQEHEASIVEAINSKEIFLILNIMFMLKWFKRK
ncbi:MAG: hypothetical protein HC831_21070 [Chloroflexia bacterium]|nr:hypothetical protein [Chloroflexia bacterium]